MARLGRSKCKASSRHLGVGSSLLKSCSRKNANGCHPKSKDSKISQNKDWEGATCSVCLEFPHNAVLLLCSSYDKGCRPYMCSTSHRFSNCLEQYKKANTKVTSVEGQEAIRSIDDSTGNDKMGLPQLLCPLCRGQVKGWTVVESARKYLNAKKRTCMQEKCSFFGTYNQLKRHVREKHPLARPRAVDPAHEAKWKKFEFERDRNDVISTIMSSTPGAVVLGDYVIEPGYHGMYDDDYDSDESLDDEDGFLPLEPFNDGHGSSFRFHNGYHLGFPSLDEIIESLHRRVVHSRIHAGRYRRSARNRGSS